MPRHRFVGTRARLLPLTLVAALLPAAARAEVPQMTPECTAELAQLDQSFAESLTRILISGNQPQPAQCAALANQLVQIARETDAHMRCYPPGDALNSAVAMLTGSATDFRQAQGELGCNSGA
jgi:hypothetical protein